MHRFLEELNPESRMFRFFSLGTDLRAAARSMVDVDYTRRYGLVAIRERRCRRAGALLRRWRRETPRSRSRWRDRLQGMGLATLLLAHLAEVALDNGISVFWAEVMPENHRMIEVFRESGFPVEMSSEPGAIRVELPTSFATRPSDDSRTETGSRPSRRFARSSSRRRSPSSARPAIGTRSAASSSTTPSSPGSRASSIPSTPAPTWCRRCTPTGTSATCRRTSSWR